MGVRVDLAACYRLAAHYRMTDLIYTQIAAMSGGTKLRIPAPSVAGKTAAQFKNLPYKPQRPEWKALRRMLDKTDPSYKN